MKGADATVRIAFCLIVTIMLLTFIAERDGIEYLYNLGIILLPLLGLLIVFNAICYVASKRLERTTEAREDLNQLRPHEPTVATVEVGERRINPMLASVIAQLREYGNVPQVTLPTYNRAVRTTAPAKLAVPIYSELPENLPPEYATVTPQTLGNPPPTYSEATSNSSSEALGSQQMQR